MTIHMDKENIISSFYDSFNYHEKKVEQGVAKFIEGTVSKNDSVNIKSKCFELIHSLNSRVKLKGFDIPFTFDKDDSMNDRTFKDMFSEFQNDMGFNDRPYSIYRHDDTDNLHYHVVIGNVNYDGVPNPVLRTRYRKKVTNLAREYEQKYNLRKLNKIGFSEGKAKKLNEINFEKYSFQKSLLAQDGKKLNLSKEEKVFLSSNRTNDEIKNKETLNNSVQYLISNDLILKSNKQKLISLLDESREKNLIEHIKQCQEKGLYCRVVKRPKTHFVYGIKDDKNEIMYFKESSLPQRFSYLSIKNKALENKVVFSERKQKSYLKTIVNRVAKQSNSFEEFEKTLLDKYNVQTITNKNKVKTTGVSFKSLSGADSKTFKGSEIDLSYNKLVEKFNLSTSPKEVKSKTKSSTSPKEDKGNTSSIQSNTPKTDLSPGDSLSNMDSNKPSAFGMENFVDEEEEKKRKKKKRGRSL